MKNEDTHEGGPKLTDYDVILINSSAGKDSQTMIDVVVEQADALGIRDRLVIVHADMKRMDWKGTAELAKTQADHYGIRFEVVTREKGDLIDMVAARGKWPSSSCRFCTSDLKRDQVQKLITKIDREQRAQGKTEVRILNCLGLRAEESPARKKRPAFSRNRRASTATRTVDEWLPIHDWTEAQVWDRIRKSGVPHHYAYDLGMPRLSCAICIFAPKAALVLAGRHNRELLDTLVDLEATIGHRFTNRMSIAEVKTAVEANEEVGALNGAWNM